MRSINGVPGAGVVDVISVLIRHGAVITEVINPLKRQGWSQLVALRRVVIDHVEDHLDARVMIGTHHVAETLDARRAVIAGRWRKETERVIAPEVFQAAIEQVLIVREPVNR